MDTNVVKEEPMDLDLMDAYVTELEIKEEPEFGLPFEYFDETTHNEDSQLVKYIDGRSSGLWDENGDILAERQTDTPVVGGENGSPEESRTNDERMPRNAKSRVKSRNRQSRGRKEDQQSAKRVSLRVKNKRVEYAQVSTPSDEMHVPTRIPKKTPTPRPHHCPICGAAFQTKFCVRRHVVIHSGVKPYVCEICGWSFYDKSNLTAHYKKNHWNQFKCGVCSRVFMDSKTLEKHSGAHANEKANPLLVCAICGASFKYRLRLKKHCEQHQQGNSESSSSTGAVVRASVDACDGMGADAVDRETGGSDILGARTGPSVPNRRLRKRSRASKSRSAKTRGFKCAVCSKVFVKPISLKCHVKYHRLPHQYIKDGVRKRLFPCKFCGATFKIHKCLNRHLDRVHWDDFPDDTKGDENTKKTAEAQLVGVGQQLSEHVNGHVKEEVKNDCEGAEAVDSNELSASDSILAVEVEPSTSRDCHEGISISVSPEDVIGIQTNFSDSKEPSASGIIRVNAEHSSSRDCHEGNVILPFPGDSPRSIMSVDAPARLHECDICKRRFAQEDDLKIHRRTHPKSKLCACHICGKVLSCTKGLRRHIELHTGYSHQCNVCGKFFRVRHYLLRHMKRHSPGYRCDICMKTFTKKITLQWHSKLHGAKPFLCHMCGESYKSKESLQLHSQKYHGKKGLRCFDTARPSKVETTTAQKAKRKAYRKPRKHVCTVCRASFGSADDLSNHYTDHLTENTPGAYVVMEVLDEGDAEPGATVLSITADLPGSEVMGEGGGFGVANQSESEDRKKEGDGRGSSDSIFSEKSEPLKGRDCELVAEESHDGRVHQPALARKDGEEGDDVVETPTTLGNDQPSALASSDESSVSSEDAASSLPSICHFKTTNAKRQFRKLRCRLCNQWVKSIDELVDHCKKHAKKNFFPCFICGVSFSRLYCLKRHAMLHTGVKPHKCAVCGRSFCDRSNLTAHYSTHYVNRYDMANNKCDICGNVYEQKRSLNRHYFTHHAEALERK